MKGIYTLSWIISLDRWKSFPQMKTLLYSSLSKKNQVKEVSSHYDIGNGFYELSLDETLSYSCGYFKTHEDRLYQDQVNKADYILQKLHLEKGMTLLDIGCGWGFLLIEAAKRYQISGTGITLSHEQRERFNSCIKEEGLEVIKRCFAGWKITGSTEKRWYGCLTKHLSACGSFIWHPCAAAFHNGIIDLHQILATKGINNKLSMTRWY